MNKKGYEPRITQDWDHLYSSQMLLRQKSLMLLDALRFAGVEGSDVLRDKLEARDPRQSFMPASIDDVAFDLDEEYEITGSPETKQLANLAHAANFVVGSETIRELYPSVPNLTSLKWTAGVQVMRAEISDTAKQMLVRLNQNGI